MISSKSGFAPAEFYASAHGGVHSGEGRWWGVHITSCSDATSTEHWRGRYYLSWGSGVSVFNFWRCIPRMRSGFLDIEKEYIPRTSFCIPTLLSVVLTAEQTSRQGHRWPHGGPTCRAQQLPCLRRAANFQASQRACPLPPFPGNEHT